MSEQFKVRDEKDVLDAVSWSLSEEQALQVIGGGSKSDLGRATNLTHSIDLKALSGITLYEPDELVLSAHAATPLVEIERLLAENRQELAFEPADPHGLFGNGEGRQTIGGALAVNQSGPRRFMAGAARDHFLGVRAVSGRAEIFKSGGRVVKNVTGYDLCKLMAGSYGTLGVMTHVTVKVLPAAERTRTVLLYGLGEADAVSALARAAGGPYYVSGLAHLPASVAARSSVDMVNGAGRSVTAIRIEGTEVSTTHRTASLREALKDFDAGEELHSHRSHTFWHEMRDVGALLPTAGHLVWKISVTPDQGPSVLASLRAELGGEGLLDWGGGLIWYRLDESAGDDGGATAVRRIVAGHGHATLMKAPAELRARVPVFHPQAGPLAALAGRVKDSFDPKGILNPQRMYADY